MQRKSNDSIFFWQNTSVHISRRTWPKDSSSTPAVGTEGTECGRRNEKRRGSPYYVVWTHPSCSISNVCLHKPRALRTRSSSNREMQFVLACTHKYSHTHTHTHRQTPSLKQTMVACLTNWAHLFTLEIFIEQLGLLCVSCCFSFRGFLPSPFLAVSR